MDSADEVHLSLREGSCSRRTWALQAAALYHCSQRYGIRASTALDTFSLNPAVKFHPWDGTGE